jgi:signal peptidase I
VRLRAIAAAKAGASKPELLAHIEKMENAVVDWAKAFPSARARESVQEILVAVVSILAFTTFFLQLTKIPTGSMQPSLYGITYEAVEGQLPSRLSRLARYWTLGISHHEIIAPFDGQVLKIEPVRTLFPFVKRQRLLFGDSQNTMQRQWLTVWFPPDERWPEAARLAPERKYRRGEAIVRLRGRAGDHLLVDRLTYNLRRPRRGEVFVFTTRGIPQLPEDVLYIKRLVGLPGEEVQIGDDQHLIIDRRRLNASEPAFERVYTITHPGESRYSGHVNDRTAREKFGFPAGIPFAPLFPDGAAVFKVPPGKYLAMGDNTLNSLDSRAWGAVDRRNITGRCWFVYWPLTERFGWGTW